MGKRNYERNQMAVNENGIKSGPVVMVIDYGASNLTSVQKAFSKLGYEARVSESAGDLAAADALVLPGQGAAQATMEGLRERGLVEPVVKAISDGRPFFGVCMGLQVLFDYSAEGEQECLGVFPGTVNRLPSSVKLPHMGWNQVRQSRASPLFKDIADDSYFYFVHSYHPDPADSALVLATTEYGRTFCCASARDNVVATLFHPEKSGALGLRMYKNFMRNWVLEQRWK